VRNRFTRLTESLAKTRRAILGGIRSALGRGAALDESGLDAIEETLVSADVGVDTSMHLVDVLRTHVGHGAGGPEDIAGVLSDEIERILCASRDKPSPAEDGSEGEPTDAPGPADVAGPRVLMIVGVNGVGKTTSIGKLATRFVSRGDQVIVAAADTFRAAASEQLSIWADRSGAQFVAGEQGGDPAAVAFDALDAAVSRGADLLIVDTAGRLHTQKNLLEELRKIKRVLAKRMPGAPHEVLLVVDANTGQNALSQARIFDEAVGVTGIVLAKLDGTARGGIVIPIARELSIPVRFVGTGEGPDDLEEFDPTAFAHGLLGVGQGAADRASEPSESA